MGISGLLPLIRESLVKTSLAAYKDKTVAVDAYVWLHRGVYTCAQEVALGQETTKYVAYCMGRLAMMQHFGVKPYIVFDGSLLPSKRGTEIDRASKRADALKKANAALAAGKRSAARDEFAKAVDVTPAMAYQFIKALRAADIPFVVAPYEADAQLAFLERHGHVDAILSEDSDLVIFGCSTVLFKLDQSGAVEEYRRDRLTQCTEFRFHGWTEERLRNMAILCGCDYLEGLNGLGLKTAHGFFYRLKTAPKVIEHIKLAGKIKVPKTYHADVERANITFMHQVVFDPQLQEVVHLSPLPSKGLSKELLEAVGGLMTNELARKIAYGDVDPSTGKAMIDICPLGTGSTANSGTNFTTSFYRSKAIKTPCSSGPLDSFFVRSTAVQPKSTTKRTALREIKANTCDSPSSSAENPIASKFFGGRAELRVVAKPTRLHIDHVESVRPTQLEQAATLLRASLEKPARPTLPVSDAPDVGDSLCTTSDITVDIPTSEITTRSPSTRQHKRRRLLEAEEMEVFESSQPAQSTTMPPASSPLLNAASPSTSNYFASPISSPLQSDLSTPARTAVANWNALFHRSSSSTRSVSQLPDRDFCAKQSDSRSPEEQRRSFWEQQNETQSPAMLDFRTTMQSPDAASASTCVETVTSRERPLSSFMYRPTF